MAKANSRRRPSGSTSPVSLRDRRLENERRLHSTLSRFSIPQQLNLSLLSLRQSSPDNWTVYLASAAPRSYLRSCCICQQLTRASFTFNFVLLACAAEVKAIDVSTTVSHLIMRRFNSLILLPLQIQRCVIVHHHTLLCQAVSS